MSAALPLYEWRTRGEENCPRCAALAGVVLPLETWQALVLPGFHGGCDCELVRVGTTLGESDTPLRPLPPEDRFPGKGPVPRPRPRAPRRPGPKIVME
ncbi:MAG: hypothetical protein HPY85_17065 [Anaerolineae bacterium]|nr:hypothetical protein [Anaerolineae bacterium]